MSAPKTIGAFFGWLTAALFCVSFTRIYAFGRFEGSLGSQLDNLLLSAFFDMLIALLVTAGFAAAMLRRRGFRLSFPGLRLPLASAVACGLVYAFTFTGLFLSARFESWELNVSLFALYSVLVGAVIAIGLMRLTKARENAA
jgi:hypothetical protein